MALAPDVDQTHIAQCYFRRNENGADAPLVFGSADERYTSHVIPLP
jgi:hypothetical protein